MSRPSQWHRCWSGETGGYWERELCRISPPGEVVVRVDCRSDVFHL